MMCLPSISRMTDRRERDAERIRKSKLATCDCCNKEYSTKLPGCYVEECFSPLIADKASSIVTICPECAEKNSYDHGQPYGSDGEESNYFTCADCGKLNVYAYSWEIYAILAEDGYICQECAGKRYLAEGSDQWLTSTEAIEAATKTYEALQEYAPKHLSCIGGSKKFPLGVVSFRDTAEYEADGENWFSKMEMGGWSGGGSGLREVRECALAAAKHYGKVAIIVGEAGQFQVYLDIVVDPDSRLTEKKARKSKKTKAA